tara:strand:- start:501 stop:755 length:255 start_codon:yes stop_codon:yes gene_type:complete
MKANFETYATISIDDLAKVDFEQVGQTSNETVRRSLDLTQFILSWNQTPTFIEDELIVPIAEYDHAEILEVVQTDQWQENDIDE